MYIIVQDTDSTGRVGDAICEVVLIVFIMLEDSYTGFHKSYVKRMILKP
jgi:hypothetical protein